MTDQEIINTYVQKLKDKQKVYSEDSLYTRVEYELLPVLKIAKVMTEELCNHNGTYFYIHSFVSKKGVLYEYAVICWNGNEYSILPYNIAITSRNAIVQDLGRYISGGYYDEVEYYREVSKPENIETELKLSTLDL